MESSLLHALYPSPAKIDLLRINFSYILDCSTSLKTANTCWTATLQIISKSSKSWFIVRTIWANSKSKFTKKGNRISSLTVSHPGTGLLCGGRPFCGMQIKFHPNPKNREKRRALSIHKKSLLYQYVVSTYTRDWIVLPFMGEWLRALKYHPNFRPGSKNTVNGENKDSSFSDVARSNT